MQTSLNLSPRIDRSAPTPLYFQIAERLRHDMISRKLQQGDLFTTDERVQELFGVSRATARKAIDELVDEGLVERITGKGTFVVEPRLQVPLPAMLSFTEELLRRGVRPGTRVISADWAKAGNRAAHALGATAETRVLRLERVRYADEKPILHAVDYLPQDLGIGPEDDFSGSLYGLMESCGIKLADCQNVIEASLTDDWLGKQLDVAAGFPILFLRRTTYDAKGTSVLYEESSCRGDSYSYSIRLCRHPSGA